MAEQKQSLYLRVQEKLSNVSTVNSYKELCKLLDETDYSKPSQKKHKKKQLENWKKCFTWTEPNMIPKIQKFVEENKKKVETREVDKDDE